jgi:hypothetical protein
MTPTASATLDVNSAESGLGRSITATGATSTSPARMGPRIGQERGNRTKYLVIGAVSG